MNIIGLKNLQTVNTIETKGTTSADATSSFSKMLTDAVDKLNQSQKDSDKAIAQYMNGETDDLHNVMITVEKSSILLQTAVEVRNKVIEAYQDIMRMQV